MRYVLNEVLRFVVVVTVAALCVSTSWSNELVFTAIPDQDTSDWSSVLAK